MNPRVPRVHVAQAEAGGFVITCNLCPGFRTMRHCRTDADQAAVTHRRTRHAQPSPEDERAAHLDLLRHLTRSAS